MKNVLLAFLAVLTINFANAQNIIITIAGNDTAGYSGDGGMATLANINSPTGIAADNFGNIYFADQGNYRIRKISISGTINTIAGNGSYGYSGDGGPATDATFSGNLYAVAVDTSGNIYIADRDNHVIREVLTTGIITTIAGTGSAGYSGDGGAATAATFFYPCGVSLDHFGNVYITDQSNHAIRKVNSSGIVTTVAGNGSGGFSGDGGPATAASLYLPCYTTVSNTGEIFISDMSNNRVRKVSTAGIITTIAGNGTSGYTGDGSMATDAEIAGPLGIALDNSGNLYMGTYCVIRKINSTGIISTVAGNGTVGYTGDGGPATAAELGGPWGIIFDQVGNLYMALSNNVIRKIENVPTFVADSFNIFVNKFCSGPQIMDILNHSSPGMYMKTYYGDGNSDSSSILSSGSATFTHSYAANGTYSIKQVLHTSTAVIDSFQFTYDYTLCNSFSVGFYYDANSDCIKDSTDVNVTQPVLVEIDSNGVAIDTISTTSGLYYTAYGSIGDVYAFKVVSTPSGFYVSCPSTGIIYDTLGTSLYSAPAQNIALQCTSSTAFDLSLNAVVYGPAVNDEYGSIYIQNIYCMPENATVTLHYSPKYDAGLRDVSPAPSSTSVSTVTWNLSDLSSAMAAPIQINYGVWRGSAVLIPGDTVGSYFTVTPITGDADTTNNNEIIIDTVKDGYDPNEISVSPNCFATGATSNQLKYTINFENTGNDTAHNIYLMDTLPDNVDASTMRIVMSSNEMYTSKLKDAAGHNIFKFDFLAINLLDSSHHGKCDGAVIFTIETKPGLATGVDIKNRAGIYFDVNPVVMTNTAQTTVGCPVVNAVVNTVKNNKIDIYPNPANNELTIKTAINNYQSLTITNIVGQQAMQQDITSVVTNVNINALPAGIYYIIFKGDGGSVVRRFVKE